MVLELLQLGKAVFSVAFGCLGTKAAWDSADIADTLTSGSPSPTSASTALTLAARQRKTENVR